MWFAGCLSDQSESGNAKGQVSAEVGLTGIGGICRVCTVIGHAGTVCLSAFSDPYNSIISAWHLPGIRTSD